MKLLFIIPTSKLPCAVQQASRLAAKFSHANICDVNDYKAIKSCDRMAINLPLVAWKKLIFAPIFAMLYGLIYGKERLVMLHEWVDLDWKRRVVIAPILLLANKIIFSSPLVLQQFQTSILNKFVTKRRDIFPVASNLQLPIVNKNIARAQLNIGHFGSIYPSKNSLQLLDIAFELKKIEPNFTLTYIGDFVKASYDIEGTFYKRVKELGLEAHVHVTGYVESLEELSHIFNKMSVFVYPFSEGLTSRRTSILAVAQAGRPIITTKALREDEFNHHHDFQVLLKNNMLHYVDKNDYVAKILELRSVSSVDFQCDKNIIPEAMARLLTT